MINIRHLMRKVLSSGWIKLSLITFSMKRRNGQWQDGLKREVCERGAAIAVLPYDITRKTVLLVRQLRIPVLLIDDDGMLLEACAGVIDKGETDVETVLREAKEELGYELSNLKKIACAYSSPGFSTEQMSLFLGIYTPESRCSTGGGLEDEGEDIEIIEMTFAHLIDIMENGKIQDLKTLYLIEALRSHIKNIEQNDEK